MWKLQKTINIYILLPNCVLYGCH